MNTKTIKTLFPFLILLAFLAYNLEAGIENSFPNGAMVRDASNHADNALGNLGAYSKAEVDAIVATPTAEIAAHATSNNTHGCTVIASEAAIAAHAALSTTHNATTLASEAYVTGYAAKLAGDAAQDFSAKILTLGGNLKTGTNWISGDGDNEGVQINAAGEALIATTTDAGDYKLQVNGNTYSGGTTTLGGNLKTGSNWISGDGDNEGIYVDAAGEVLIATTTDAGDYKLQVNGNAYVSGTISGADTWHEVDGVIATFTNSWEDFDAGGESPICFWKDPNGIVHLRGAMKSGTIGSGAFTLPAGYRPAYPVRVPAVTYDNIFGCVYVTSLGVVAPLTGSNVIYWLDGISFRAEQ